MKYSQNKIYNKDRDRAITSLNFRIMDLEKILEATIHHFRDYIKWNKHDKKFNKYQEKKLEERGMVEEKPKTQKQMDRT